MPKRTKIDKQKVFDLYQELKNATEVAKQLGIHRNTVYQYLRQINGKCIDCSNQAKIGFKHCETCIERINQRTKEKRKKRKRQGLCQQCDNYIQPPSNLYCAEHRLKHIEANEKHGENRRKAISQLEPSERKYEMMKYRYGGNAIKVWEKYNGKCAICNRSDEEIAIHIHHIDCNDKNHNEDNLICLCFDCHSTTHKLIDHVPDPTKLIEWIKKTYPNTF